MEEIRRTESSWSEFILRHREFLIEQVESDFGLVDKLFANKVLSKKEKADTKAENTIYKRNSKILEYAEVKAQYCAYIEALQSSNQTHVVNYLEKDGVYAFYDDWPLLEAHRSILQSNQESLVDLLDVIELINLLYAAGVINRRQRDFISSKQTPYEKNDTLLDILSRRSIRDYKETIRCLHESKQSHIAQILEEGGVTMKVHVGIPDEKTEDEMISQFAYALKNRSLQESRRILEGTLNVIAVEKGHSIVIYVYCKTLGELLNLQKLDTSGKLVTVLQELFINAMSVAKCTEGTVESTKNVEELPLHVTEIYQRSQIEKMTAAIYEEAYDRFKQYFLIEEKRMTEDASPHDQLEHFTLKAHKVEEREPETVETPADLNEDQEKTEERYADVETIPREVLEIILRKSFIHSSDI